MSYFTSSLHRMNMHKRAKNLRLLSFFTVLLLLLTSCSVPFNDTPNITSPAGNDAGSISNNAGDTVSSAESLDDIAQTLDLSFTDHDLGGSYHNDTVVSVVFHDNAVTAGNGVKAVGADITITEAGTYVLSGSSENGSITVNATSADKVQILLAGLSLTSQTGPALFVECADKVFLTLAENTNNALTDASVYTRSSENVTLDAAIFSRDDLTINGSGTLTVTANCKHGIVSKDDLIITDGQISVTAPGAGICGKDRVKITGTSLSVTAGTDGIRAGSNDETAPTDSTLGYFYLAGGSVTVIAADDGVQAEHDLILSGGTMDITCGGGSANAAAHASDNMGMHGGFWGQSGSVASGKSSNDTSAKGLKAGARLLVSGGTVVLDTADDGLHAAASLTLEGGTLTINAGDDGIHCDAAVSITGSNITVSKSYEGIEGSDITISGGNISVKATDDGINVSSGSSSSATGIFGRPGMGGATNGTLTISGGYLYVNADGDGLDSNGNLAISGGIILVSGPTSNNNGAIDYETTGQLTGGILIALGSSGMSESFTAAQNQVVIHCAFPAQSAGTAFTVCDQSGNVIVSFTPEKAYASAVVTAPSIVTGSQYTILTGGEVADRDANGYAADTSITGATVVGEITPTSTLCTANMGGTGSMSGPGGMVGPGGKGDPGGKGGPGFGR